MIVTLRRLVFAACCVLLTGCGADDLTSVHLTLAPDGSGTIKSSSASIPTESTMLERESQGATWTHRVKISGAIGTFASISQLAVADITFEAAQNEGSISTLTVRVPRGPRVRWVETIAPATEQQRIDAARAFDPSGDLDQIGAKVKLHIELPGEVTSTGVMPVLRGINSSYKKQEATLLLPVEQALSAGEDILWHVAWK